MLHQIALRRQVYVMTVLSKLYRTVNEDLSRKSTIIQLSEWLQSTGCNRSESCLMFDIFGNGLFVLVCIVQELIIFA